MMRLGLTALIFSAAMGLYACGGDDDATPGDNNEGDASVSSSSGGSSSGNTPDGDASTSSSSGGSSSGNTDGSVSLCPEAPVTYPDADQFAENAGPGVGFRSLLVALNARMTELETANAVPADTAAIETELTTLYAGANEQVHSLARVASAERKTQVEGIIESFVEGLGKTYNPTADTPTAGKYGKWLFDARGVDLRQIVEKGGFGHELYQITSASDPRPWNGARFDQVVAVYGATPVFGHANTPAPDTPILLARYASGRDARRDGETGIYFKFRDQVILGKHAAATDANVTEPSEALCAAEHTAAIDGLRRTWEETVVATAIYYLGSSPAKLNAAVGDTESDDITPTRAQGLHAFGEAIGFLWGVRTLPEAQRVATDAQLDAVLTELKIAPAGPVEPGSFVGNNSSETAFADAIALLKNAYGFSDQQITDFKANYQPPAPPAP